MLTWKPTAMAYLVLPDRDRGDGSIESEIITLPERGLAIRLRSVIPKEAMNGGNAAVLKAWSDDHDHEVIELESKNFMKRCAELSRRYPRHVMSFGVQFFAERGSHHILSIVQMAAQWTFNVLRMTDGRGPQILDEGGHGHKTIGIYSSFAEALDAAEAWRVADTKVATCECKEIDDAPVSSHP